MNDQIPNPPQFLRFQFTGTGGEYFKIWIVNLLLTILTLGIYSAWAKVRRERYFYSNTHLAEHTFEYLAEPMAILKGRAIAFAVLAGSSAVASFFPLAEPAFSLAFLALLPWIVVKGLKFRMRNSAFKNISFNFNGNYGEAAKAYILWPLLTPLTLGLTAPLMFHRQNRLLVANTQYGTTPFEFSATPKDFYKVVGIYVLAMALAFALVFLVARDFLPQAFVVAIIPLGLLAYAYFRSHIINTVFNHTEFGPHQLESRLQTKGLFWIYLTNALGIALTAGLFAPWAKVRLAKYKADHTVLIAQGNLDDFVAGQHQEVSSVGSEMSEAFDVDLGL
ncbi:MAG: hypothetical protein AXA67_13800 [Methylothermaceae bacteria B42]|nr:MAG: hypothetical protein AXA67_13800 [Methylothermaceae bacteria B42]HHJ38301.1 DUF898 domain-containing protein [Methylothermaceae bacterium]